MFGLRRRLTVIVIALSMAATGAVGGVVGALVASNGAANTIALAASTSPTPSSSSGSGTGGAAHPSTSNGKFVSNEDPTHEQGESAAREAQENAGQVPTVP